jgi:hypothetical protein
MVKVRDVDGLIDDQMEHPPGQWVSIRHHPSHSRVNPGPESFVVAHYRDRSIIVEGYQGMPI